MTLRYLSPALALLFVLGVVVTACGDSDPPAPTPPSATASPPTIPVPAVTPAPAAIPTQPPVVDTPELQTPLPALRFAGAPLLYVLQRIAGTSGVLLGIDTIRPVEESGESEFTRRFVDIDLPAGTVGDALAALQKDPGGFLYKGMGGGIYLRADIAGRKDPLLDRLKMPPGTYLGDFTNLSTWLRRGTKLVIHNENSPGTPVWKKVKLELTEPTPIVQFLMLYGKAVNSGWIMQRAAYEHSEQVEGEQAFVVTDISLFRDRKLPFQRPGIMPGSSVMTSIRAIADRTDTPICVVDWSMNPFVNSPYLAMPPGLDPQTSPASTALKQLAPNPAGMSDRFKFEKRDGVIVVYSSFYEQFAGLGEQILSERVPAGSFSGTLGDLARWLNQNRDDGEAAPLLAGEILPYDPVAQLEVKEGSTVEDVLLAFTAQTGMGWAFAQRGTLVSHDGSTSRGRWLGAFISPLDLWHKNGLEGVEQRINPAKPKS